MKNTSGIKAKIFAVILTLVSAAVFLSIGLCVKAYCKKLETHCTADVSGIVVHEGSGPLSGVDPACIAGISSNKHWRKIKVETDGKFTLNTVYDRPGAEHKDDWIIIHYNPDAPENYYVGDRLGDLKAAKTAAYIAGALSLLMGFFAAKAIVRESRQRKDSRMVSR